MDLANIDVFLSGLGDSADTANGALAQSQSLGQSLMQYIQGFGAADPYGGGSSGTDPSVLDNITASLMKTWQGSAADAFNAQIQIVRSFGVGIAATADKTWNNQASGVTMPPASMQYEFESLADYVGAMGTLSTVFSDIHDEYVKLGNNFSNWALGVAQQIRNTSADISNWVVWSTDTTRTVPVPTFAEFVAGHGTSGQLKVNYSDGWAFDPGHTDATYSNPALGLTYQLQTINWPFVGTGDDQVTGAAKDLQENTHNSEFRSYLPNLMNDLAHQYTSVQPPPPQDNSVLPKTSGSGSSSGSQSSQNYSGGWSPGVSSLGTGGPFGGTGSPYGSTGGPFGGASGSVPGVGADSPVSYNPSSLTGSGLPGSGASGWDPTQLAGFNPNAGGGLGPGGGLGIGSGGGLGAGGNPLTGSGGADLGAAGGLSGADGGLGTGADVAGAASAAGRAMPMAPMGGMGGGKEGKERQRAAWLTEDEDVWGTGNDDGGDAVL